MPVKPTQHTRRLKTLLNELDAGKIRVDSTYQRSGKIWPAHAKSFLVETILRGMPIPRVLLHKIGQAADDHQADIIDGQQRCSILLEYRQNEFSLTDHVDAKALRGKTYAE